MIEKKQIKTFEEAVDYLYAVPRFTSKNTMEDTKAYLKRLGNPDKNLKIIHVAGTNGKGSVCAYLRCILEEAGYRVAVFTSPHLVDVRERFIVAGEMISKEAFLEAFLQIYESLDWESLAIGKGYHPTFFEYLFFMAMLIFPKEQPDYCILETGLGGRLDATNAVEEKALTVITRIGLDHVEYLGNTLPEIAGEKAGIMRSGVPLVFTDTDREVTQVFTQKARELDISLYPVSKNDYAFLNFKNKNIDFSLHTRYYGYVRLTLHTLARYQMENASLAVRALEALDEGSTISAEHIQAGVCRCFWQGRMEEVLPEVYVDGAHNEDGIRAFLETVKEDGMEAVGSRTLLFSVVEDKDYRLMIEKLAASKLFSKIAIAHMQTGRAAELSGIRELFVQNMAHEGNADINILQFDNVKDAFRSLVDEKEPGERIYIAGSLYLVGEIKELLNND